MSKRKLTIWVDESTDQRVRDLAAMHNLTLSETAGSYLEQAIRAKAETLGMDLLTPIIEAAVRREVGRMSERLARLLARTALEAASTRRIVYNQLIRQGVDAETAKAINDQSWQRSVESLNKPLAAVDELIRASVEP